MAFDKRKALQAALAYTQQGRVDKAIAEYETILKVDPNDFAVNNALGDLYARRGDTDQAVARYIRLGELYRADGDAVKAIALYKKVLKLKPQNIDASLACANLYAEQGLLGEAKIQYMGVAEQYLKQGENRKALEIYQRIADLEPGNSVLFAKLADMLAKEGMIQEAVARLSKGAQAARKMGHLGEAVRLLKKIVQLDPGSFEAHSNLGRLLFQSGSYDEAIQELSIATSVDPTNISCLPFLGQAYEQKGLLDEAVGVYQKIVGLDPQAMEPRLHLGQLFLRQEKFVEAFNQYDAVAERLINQGKPDSAFELFRGILDVDPTYAKARVKLAELLVRAGDLERAKEEFTQLAVFYAEAGRLDEERAVYEKILSIDPQDSLARSRLQDMGVEGPLVAEEAGGEDAVQWLETFEEREAYEPSPIPSDQGLEEPVELAPLMEEAEGLEEPGEMARMEEPSEYKDPFGEVAILEEEGPSALEELSTSPLQVEIPEREIQVSLEGDPLVSEALVEAEVYLKYGLYERAINQLKATSAMFPENITLHSKLKDLYLSRGLVGEGAAEALAIAELYLHDGRTSEAAMALEEVLTLAPGNERAQELLRPLTFRESPPEVSLPPSPAELPPEVSALGEREPEDLRMIEIQDEELPEEVQAFLEEDREGLPEEEIRVLEEPFKESSDLSEDLAEAEFYLQQGMHEEARITYERILAKAPHNHEAKTKLAELTGEEGPAELQFPAPATPEAEELFIADIPMERRTFEPSEASLIEELLGSDVGLESPVQQEEGYKEAPSESIVEPVSEPALEERDLASQVGGVVPIFKVMEESGEPGEEGFFDLSAALLHELEAEESGIPSVGAGPTLEEILAEFQKGIRENLTEEDYETHYNLGIAYKEMELYDEAIEEFKLASRDRKRFVSCSDLIGLCYLAKGSPEQAIQAFQQGISVQGFPPEEGRGLRYDLVTAYEALGDLQKAYTILQELQAEDPRFRDVRARLREIQGRLTRQSEPQAPGEPPSSESVDTPRSPSEQGSSKERASSPAESLPPPKRKASSKDRISFI
ncbi:MAG: tetratricopeptide repeat protein [candidate division NC10 bacterium]|nr:tetratricopeptide repeat protein [candidate division NC10 bacterium]